MEHEDQVAEAKRKAVFAQKDQDLADLNAERAGWENGRITRFLHNDPRHKIEQKKQRDQEVVDAHLTALDILRQNAAYEAAYQQTMRFLTDLSQEAENVINAAINTLRDLRNQHDTMLASAPGWQDDQHLFRDKDGNVRDQHGQIIEGLTAKDVVWPEGTPTYEDWLALQDRIIAMQTHLDSWQNLRDNHIAPAQERLADEDDPLTMEGMKSLRETLTTKADEVRQISFTSPEMERSTPPSRAVAITLPSL